MDELSFRCGQMSLRREAANVLPIIAGIRQCSAVGVRLASFGGFVSWDGCFELLSRMLNVSLYYYMFHCYGFYSRERERVVLGPGGLVLDLIASAGGRGPLPHRGRVKVERGN